MAKDNSFDIVSQIDLQEVDNAINQSMREISQRFDLKDTNTTVERSEGEITINAPDDLKLKNVIDILQTKMAQRKVSLKALEYEKVEHALGGRAKQVIKLQQGIDKEQAKKITALIKASKIKVQASIQGETVRVSGKKRDDLQAVMQLVKDADLPMSLQFVNFR